MAWQDIRGWYEEQDDGPAAEVELVECRCWWCDRPFKMPVDDPERFCSLECGNRWCADADGRVYCPPPAADSDDIPF